MAEDMKSGFVRDCFFGGLSLCQLSLFDDWSFKWIGFPFLIPFLVNGSELPDRGRNDKNHNS